VLEARHTRPNQIPEIRSDNADSLDEQSWI
jgi:hypothetical protein